MCFMGGYINGFLKLAMVKQTQTAQATLNKPTRSQATFLSTKLFLGCDLWLGEKLVLEPKSVAYS